MLILALGHFSNFCFYIYAKKKTQNGYPILRVRGIELVLS